MDQKTEILNACPVHPGDLAVIEADAARGWQEAAEATEEVRDLKAQLAEHRLLLQTQTIRAENAQASANEWRAVAQGFESALNLCHEQAAEAQKALVECSEVTKAEIADLQARWQRCEDQRFAAVEQCAALEALITTKDSQLSWQVRRISRLSNAFRRAVRIATNRIEGLEGDLTQSELACEAAENWRDTLTKTGKDALELLTSAEPEPLSSQLAHVERLLLMRFGEGFGATPNAWLSTRVANLEGMLQETQCGRLPPALDNRTRLVERFDDTQAERCQSCGHEREGWEGFVRGSDNVWRCGPCASDERPETLDDLPRRLSDAPNICGTFEAQERMAFHGTEETKANREQGQGLSDVLQAGDLRQGQALSVADWAQGAVCNHANDARVHDGVDNSRDCRGYDFPLGKAKDCAEFEGYSEKVSAAAGLAMRETEGAQGPVLDAGPFGNTERHHGGDDGIRRTGKQGAEVVRAVEPSPEARRVALTALIDALKTELNPADIAEAAAHPVDPSWVKDSDPARPFSAAQRSDDQRAYDIEQQVNRLAMDQPYAEGWRAGYETGMAIIRAQGQQVDAVATETRDMVSALLDHEVSKARTEHRTSQPNFTGQPAAAGSEDRPGHCTSKQSEALSVPRGIRRGYLGRKSLQNSFRKHSERCCAEGRTCDQRLPNGLKAAVTQRDSESACQNMAKRLDSQTPEQATSPWVDNVLDTVSRLLNLNRTQDLALRVLVKGPKGER